MPSKRENIYWDSCIFIDRLQKTPHRIQLLTELTDLAERGNILIITSTITITEVLHLTDTDDFPSEDLEKIHAYFENEWISLRSVDRRIAEHAAKLRVRFGTKAIDAVHLATALSLNLTLMHTYDHNLLGHSELHGSPKLIIREPFHPEATPLFDQPPGESPPSSL